MFAKAIPSTQEAHTGKPLRNCEAREVVTFEAERAQDGQMISYGGAVYLLDGSVILLDVVHYRCCLYDPSHIYRADIKLSSKPHSITQMGQKRIAVSLPEENIIQVLEVGSVFRVERHVYTDWPCYALVNAGDEKIVVCYKTKQLVEVVMIDLDGDKKCSLYTRNMYVNFPLATICLAYDKLRKRTCVLDGNLIRVILKDGIERFQYHYDGTGRIVSDYDQEGNLYSFSFGKICQMSVNGDILHSWSFECPSPTALCFHPNGRDFIVVNVSGKVHFFKLQ